MNAEFEQKLWELKTELETQRLQQVGTMKSVLERQHSKDIIDMDDVHQQQMDGLRDGKGSEIWDLEVVEVVRPSLLLRSIGHQQSLSIASCPVHPSLAGTNSCPCT